MHTYLDTHGNLYILLTKLMNSCYKNYFIIPCRISGGTLSVPDIPDLGMVRDGTKCADEKVIIIKQLHPIKLQFIKY